MAGKSPARAFDRAAFRSSGESALRACAERQYGERYFHLISFAGDITQPIAAIRTGRIREAQATPTKQ